MLATLALVSATLALPAQATSASACPAVWQERFGSGSSLNDRSAPSVVFDDGSGPALFVGGVFENDGSTALNGVAKWDGQRFQALGSGLSGAEVLALATYDDGSGSALFVAGAFEVNAGGSQLSNIAKWDGTSWSAVGGGLTLGATGGAPNGAVYALANYDDGTGDALYAAGWFTVAGNVAANHIARWNGTGWSALPGSTSNYVACMEVFDDGGGARLFVGTRTSLLGGLLARVASFGPNGWMPATNGATGPVLHLHAHDDGSGLALYASGAFGGASDSARWNGSGWVALGSGLREAGPMETFDDGGGAKLFVGEAALSYAYPPPQDALAIWDGASWSRTSSGVSEGQTSLQLVSGLTAFDDGGGSKLYVTGSFLRADNRPAAGFARFDGANWLPATGLIDRPLYASTTFDDGTGEALYVGGAFREIAGVACAGIAKWDGAAWTPLGSGVEGLIYALATFDDGSGRALYAGGDFTFAGGVVAGKVAKWDGTSWSSVGGSIVLHPHYLVRALLEYDDGTGPALYVGGCFDGPAGLTDSGLARWNGSTWSSIGGFLGLCAGGVFSLAAYDDGAGPKLFAGGVFTSVAGVPAQRIAMWDGSTWSGLSSGIESSVGGLAQVASLEVFDDGSGPALYVGGNFTSAGGVAANSIARWDGAGWSSVGALSSRNIGALRVFDDGSGAQLYASVGVSPTESAIASWNGSTWTNVRTSEARGFGPLTIFDDGFGDALFVGGSIPAPASGRGFVSRYGCATPPPTYFCRPAAPGTTHGCVATITASGNPDTAHSTDCTLSVANLEGQRSALLFYGVSGAMSASWCGPNASSRLCVAPPYQRLPVRSTGGAPDTCTGTLVENWNAFQLANPSSLGAPWSSGATVRAQAWFRDPLACHGSALSEGVELTYY